jgi:hypothetical protein
MRRISACRSALSLARIRFAEVSRFNWNQPFDRDFPQMWVKPKKSNVGGFGIRGRGAIGAPALPDAVESLG